VTSVTGVMVYTLCLQAIASAKPGALQTCADQNTAQLADIVNLVRPAMILPSP
jgi:hypothetical protein